MLYGLISLHRFFIFKNTLSPYCFFLLASRFIFASFKILFIVNGSCLKLHLKLVLFHHCCQLNGTNRFLLFKFNSFHSFYWLKFRIIHLLYYKISLSSNYCFPSNPNLPKDTRGLFFFFLSIIMSITQKEGDN